MYKNKSKGGERMKEAASEANMTVVAIILIGIIVAVATPIINGMMENTKKKSECTNNGQCWVNGRCTSCGSIGAGK